MKHVDILKQSLKAIDEVYDLGNEGLLKAERLYETKYRIEDKLKEIKSDFSERDQLRIEKNIPNIRNLLKHGTFVEMNEVEVQLIPLVTLIYELLESMDVLTVATPLVNGHTLVEVNNPFEGNKKLRQIFEEAKHSIMIWDPYIKPEILDVLSEFLDKNQNLEIKILTSDKINLSSIKASLITFKKQYNNSIIEMRSSGGKDHARYIIMDHELVFNPDHSLDRWGYSPVNIHSVDAAEKKKTIQNSFDVVWNKSITL